MSWLMLFLMALVVGRVVVGLARLTATVVTGAVVLMLVGWLAG